MLVQAHCQLKAFTHSSAQLHMSSYTYWLYFYQLY